MGILKKKHFKKYIFLKYVLFKYIFYKEIVKEKAKHMNKIIS